MTTITRYTRKFAHYLRHTRAVSALEYAILVGAIAVAMGAALTTFSASITEALSKIGTSIKSTQTTTPSATN